MKHFMSLTKLLALMLCITSIVYASRVLVNYMGSVDQYTLSADAYLSESIQQTLKQQIADAGTSLSIGDISPKIKDSFACVRTVDVFLLPNAQVHVAVKAHVPQYIVNGTDVVTRDGLLASKDWYCPRIVDSLYNLDVLVLDEVQAALPPACQQCVSCLSPQLLDAYRFEWEDETHAWLYDKEQPRFAILCDAHSVPDATMVQNCNTVKQELAERDEFKRRSKKIWVADVRFAKQIIVFSRG